MTKNEEIINFSVKSLNNSQFKNIELLKQLEILDTENYQLKEALTDLEKDLKDKDQSIEESQKIITKLKEEYSKVIKELQNMEKSYNELLEEVREKTIEIKNSKKNQSLLNILRKKNDSLSNEKNNLHKENIIMRKKILSCGNISFKNENDIKNKDIMIENLQIKNNNLIKMVKDREKLIEEQNDKIKELNNIINSKNEELRIMMNISKEINKENKINVKEITKQAVKTIKTFQNNNNKIKENSIDYNLLSNNKNALEEFEYIFKNNKGIFSLEDAISGVMYIPDNLNNVSKEFLINMNLKTELIKNELFSGLLRETQFINFLKKIFEALHLKDDKGVLNLFQIILKFKSKYLTIIKENYKMKKILSNLNNIDILNIQKLKESINKHNNIIKIKFIEKKNEINKLKKEIKNLNNILANNSMQKNHSVISKHLSSHISQNRINSPQICSTLPSLEYTETESINGKSSREIFNKKYFHIKRINKKLLQRRRDIINNDNNEELKGNEEIYHNNNFEYDKPFNTEVNRTHDLIYFNNGDNSTKSEIKKKNNYKRDISNLQKEINNILKKNIINNTISFEEGTIKTPKSNRIYNKINNKTIKPKKNKVIKGIFSDTMHEKKNSISILNSHECNTFKNCHISTIISRDSFNNYKNNTINENLKKKKSNNIFTADYFINLFFKINNNIFDISELNKYKESYHLTNINNIYLNFEQICNQLKNKIDEINIKIKKSHYLSESNFIERSNLRSDRKDFIDTSFKFFNEKIISLKKFEFEFINMLEYIKNYLISQEATIQIMYNKGKNYINFESIEKLFNLFEDSLSYRIDEMNENIKFSRKLLIKLFKNQINCLFLSFEYNFN